MHNKTTITVLVLSISILAAISSCVGIFSGEGPGSSTFTSVRGEEVTLYGRGVYYQMSAEVAPQGIAQDVVTLFIGIPLLLYSLFFYRKGSLRGKVLLAGTLGYFLTTYLFFTMMAMYNQLFLVWIVLLSLSFYAFYISFNSLDEQEITSRTVPKHPVKFIGGFLIFCSVSIALLWLSIIVPSALSGTVPKEVEHYTTLVVQALDLSILLPAAFLAGTFLIKKEAFGYKLSAIYLVFLCMLMTALSAKIIAMSLLGYNVIPAIFIIPFFNIMSIITTIITFKNITGHETTSL